MATKLFQVPQDWYYPEIASLLDKVRHTHATFTGDYFKTQSYSLFSQYDAIKFDIQSVVDVVKKAQTSKSSIQLELSNSEKNPLVSTSWGKRFFCECLNVKYGIKVLTIEETGNATLSFQVISNLRHPKIHSLEESLNQDRKTSNNTDFKIILNGQVFPCHCAMLKTKSPVFEGLLSNPSYLETQKGEYLITDSEVSPKVFEFFLECIYTGKTEFLDECTVKELTELFSLSHRFQIEAMEDQIIRSLRKEINKDTVAQILGEAQLFDIPALSKFCFDFLTRIYSTENKTEIDMLCKQFDFPLIEPPYPDIPLFQIIHQPEKALIILQNQLQKEKALFEFLLPDIEWIEKNQDAYILALIHFFKDEKQLQAFSTAFQEIYSITNNGPQESSDISMIAQTIAMLTLSSYFITQAPLQDAFADYLGQDQTYFLIEFGVEFFRRWESLITNKDFEEKLSQALKQHFTQEDYEACKRQLISALFPKG